MDNSFEYIDSDGQVLRLDINTKLNKYYYNSKNQFHRLDGPAIECTEDDQHWLKNDEFHRIGGPARSWPNKKFDEWWVNGKVVDIYYIYG